MAKFRKNRHISDLTENKGILLCYTNQTSKFDEIMFNRLL